MVGNVVNCFRLCSCRQRDKSPQKKLDSENKGAAAATTQDGTNTSDVHPQPDRLGRRRGPVLLQSLRDNEIWAPYAAGTCAMLYLRGAQVLSDE